MSVQIKGSGTLGGIDEGLVVVGIVTSTKVEAVGNSNGGKFGQLQIGYDPLNLTVQPISATDLHLNYNNGAYVKIGDQTTKTDIIINGDIHPKLTVLAILEHHPQDLGQYTQTLYMVMDQT